MDAIDAEGRCAGAPGIQVHPEEQEDLNPQQSCHNSHAFRASVSRKDFNEPEFVDQTDDRFQPDRS